MTRSGAVFGVQYLAQGHFDMQLSSVQGSRDSNLDRFKKLNFVTDLSFAVCC